PAQFSSTQEQETAPAPPGNKLSQPLPRKKNYPGNPGRPVAAVARAAPGVAGGCRGGPLRTAVPAGTDSSAAPLPLSPIPVSGRLRAKSIRLQSETKHCGVYLANRRARAALTCLECGACRD